MMIEQVVDTNLPMSFFFPKKFFFLLFLDLFVCICTYMCNFMLEIIPIPPPPLLFSWSYFPLHKEN